ncbi:MAG: type II secretion system F family protein [Pseudomonadota bacterium]
MEYITQYAESLGQNSDVARWIFIAMIASAVFLVGLGAMLLVAGLVDPMRRRLHDTVGYQPKEGWSTERIAEAIEPFTPYFVPTKEAERSRAGQRMIHAGYRSRSAVAIYFAIKILLMVLLPLGVLATVAWFPKLSANQVVLCVLSAAAVGLILPSYFLDRRIARRKRQLANGFPDALDLLVVCTEAGLGLNAALQRVAKEIYGSHPVLADELGLVNAEIRAGVDRVRALKNLAKRTNMEDIKGFIALLAQSLRFGTSVAETLRVYAEEFRDKRVQRAEEAAAKLGTKMIFPLVFCLFPGFFVVAIGPAVMKILAAFSGLT